MREREVVMDKKDIIFWSVPIAVSVFANLVVAM
jgi:hypothetical protein